MIDLHHKDCFEVLSTIPDHSVQLALCDLPYGITCCHWDNKIGLEALWDQFRRIMIPNRGVVAMFGAQPFTSELVMANRDWFKYSMVWQKQRPTGFQLCWQRPLCEHEDILVFSSGTVQGKHRSTRQMLYNPQGLVPMENARVRKAEQRVGFMGKLVKLAGSKQEWTNHPRTIHQFDSVHKPVHSTQKPVPLLRYLIRTYSNEGDIVLDPTMGSGSTGVAARDEKRGFIGCEMDDKYFAIAKERIEGYDPE